MKAPSNSALHWFSKYIRKPFVDENEYFAAIHEAETLLTAVKITNEEWCLMVRLANRALSNLQAPKSSRIYR